MKDRLFHLSTPGTLPFICYLRASFRLNFTTLSQVNSALLRRNDVGKSVSWVLRLPGARSFGPLLNVLGRGPPTKSTLTATSIPRSPDNAATPGTPQAYISAIIVWPSGAAARNAAACPLGTWPCCSAICESASGNKRTCLQSASCNLSPCKYSLVALRSGALSFLQ